jgi:predicted nuclease of predicted toxin-antitoxin system
MRFLADESCDFAVVRALRAADHDVLSVSESCPGADDEVVIGLASQEGRVLLTEDKDFGRLVFANRRARGGVVLLRFPARARKQVAKAVVDLATRHGERLLGKFSVVQPGRVRISRGPAG